MQPEPGLALLPEPIALALDHEGVAVMQESIEDGGGDDVVAEDLTPHVVLPREPDPLKSYGEFSGVPS